MPRAALYVRLSRAPRTLAGIRADRRTLANVRSGATDELPCESAVSKDFERESGETERRPPTLKPPAYEDGKGVTPKPACENPPKVLGSSTSGARALLPQSFRDPWSQTRTPPAMPAARGSFRVSASFNYVEANRSAAARSIRVTVCSNHFSELRAGQEVLSVPPL